MERFSTIVVGTGFASTFFLYEYLKHADASERVLVLERGQKGGGPVLDTHVNLTPQKPWIFNLAFGGGSCWVGNTPRFHPNDFRTKTLYGVGEDWPISYEDLEPFYVQVEERMGIAGGGSQVYPRSRPYPQLPHRVNAFDELLQKKYPGLHLPMPSARASQGISGRPVCCGNGICSTCPIGAKFQIDLHMTDVYDDPRVTLRLESPAERIDIQGNSARGVYYRSGGEEKYAGCDLCIIGAHAIMTPFLLLKSGLTDRALGRYLNEQIMFALDVDLDGVDNYGGSQSVTGFGIMFMDGAFRKERAGCLVENWNIPWLRAEHGRWRQRAHMKFVFEDVPRFENYVGISSQDPSKPEVRYESYSPYLLAGVQAMKSSLDTFFSGLPVERYELLDDPEELGGSIHIQGTTRMGNNPDDSVVDADLRHHKVRNLLALGGNVFPTCPAANPTLTLSALAVRAANRLYS